MLSRRFSSEKSAATYEWKSFAYITKCKMLDVVVTIGKDQRPSDLAKLHDGGCFPNNQSSRGPPAKWCSSFKAFEKSVPLQLICRMEPFSLLPSLPSPLDSSVHVTQRIAIKLQTGQLLPFLSPAICSQQKTKSFPLKI